MLLFLDSLALYLLVGVAFSVWFALLGAQRIDPVVKGAGLRFRLLLIPGAAAFWPFLLVRSLRATDDREGAE